MKAILLFLLVFPLSVSAQLTLTNSSLSNGSEKGSDGVNTVVSLLGSSGALLMPPVMQILSGVQVIPNNHPSLYNIDYSIINIGSSFKLNFEIKNSGAELQMNSAIISEINADDFLLSVPALPRTVLSGESLVFSITFSPAAAGSRTAKISFTSNDPDDNPYEFSLSGTGRKVDQVLVFNPLAQKTYGEVPFSLEATASSELNVAYFSSNTSVARVDENSITIVGAGETIITASQAGDEIFDSAPEVQQTLTVSKAVLTATAEDKTMVYGDAVTTLTIAYQGFIGEDNADVIDILPVASSQATVVSDVDNYPIMLSEGSDNNYNILAVDGNLSITQAPLTVTADDKIKMYGETPDPLLGISYSGFKGIDDESVLDISATASTNVTATSDAGNYDIIPAGGSDNNYTFSYVYGIYAVNKLTLTAIADDKTKNYGEDNPLLTITYTGFTGSENAGVVDLDPTISTSAIKESAPGTYPITLDGGSDNNYDFSFLYGTLTINPLSTPIGGRPTSTCYLTSPANNSMNVNYYATLTANMVVGAKLYTMEANIHPDFPGLSIVKQSASKDIVFLLDYNTQYYVRVKTDLAPDEWSVTSTFITGDPVSLAYVTSPRDGGTGVPSNVKVTANLLYGATSYTIELNTSPDFTGISMVNSDESRTISFKGLAKATTYFARVSSDLRPGEWGFVSSFSTMNPAGRSREDWMSETEIDLETEGIAYSIFPNPFKGHVTIHVQSLAQITLEMTLFDINGKTMEQTSSMTNRLVKIGETVVAGIYILRIATPSGIKNIRLVKI